MISLTLHWRRTLLFGAVVGCMGAYSMMAARTYVASRAALGGNYERALRLEPGNAEYWYKLGLQALFAQQNAAAAGRDYSAAVQRNPLDSRYWLDLATARLVEGDLPGHKAALERAVQMNPTDPSVRWQAANLYLAYGDQQRGKQEIRQFLQYAPAELEKGVQLCWRLEPDVDRVLQDCIPRRAEAYWLLVNWLLWKDHMEAAAHAWQRLLALGEPFPLERGLDYVSALVQHGQVDAAVEAWRELRQRDSALPGPDDGSLMTNGGFDATPPANAGFDWRYAPPQHVAVRLDSIEFHHGICSLSLTFDGSPVSDFGVFQYVPVKPGTTYLLSAYVKTENIVSSSGSRIAVVDTRAGKAVALTPDLLGNNPWQEQTLQFRTGPDTHLIVVRFMRAPADSGIEGRVWYDDFRLAEVERP